MKGNFPTRKRIRIKYYDYSKEGLYFITICTKNRKELLGTIRDVNNIELTRIGIITKKYIKQIENIFENVNIDEYIIMPNHIHMIIMIKDKKEVTISIFSIISLQFLLFRNLFHKN